MTALPFKHEDGGFLDPPNAAAHAIVVQGGFSTPAIEAFRMIEDGVRHLNVCQAPDCDSHIVAAADRARVWIDEHAGDPEVAAERQKYEVQYGGKRGTWRGDLMYRETHR